MKEIDIEIDFVCHRTAGLLNFIGGDFSKQKVKNEPFGKIMEALYKNGAEIDIKIKK